MNRRDTLSALVALGATSGPFGVRAQSNPSKQTKTLGILTHAPTEFAERILLPGLRAALKTLGWIE